MITLTERIKTTLVSRRAARATDDDNDDDVPNEKSPNLESHANARIPR